MSGNVRHVIPSDDAIEHDTSGGDANCVCGPSTVRVGRSDGSDGWIIVHSSLDGRELSDEIRQAANRGRITYVRDIEDLILRTDGDGHE
jgi:hypothetical protein